MDKTYSQPLCRGRAVNSDDPAIDANLTAVRLQNAIYDVHQGGFARPVFARQSMNLPRAQIELRVLQRLDGTERLAHVLQLKKGG